ncbi:MarR family transcriptional regulator [Curtobacterium sp. YC1]|uniref:MarR family winged helix-turn-helix transcriptional regulator n=1 Tax=Curtobacterium sp. YC1 TaxID=2795488 RepID=UPI0018E581BF|nr:MarR family transcriptional regulator [Curtobacterium sp. YC1]QQD76760.1 MarR family transcriptional regulator [Curtobacterium sp. YC1]
MPDATDLRIAVNRLSRTLRTQTADSSVTDAQFSALARLHRDGAMTLADLSRQDGVTPPSMTKTVAVLLERGFVSKCEHGDDRRKVLIGATPAGAAFVEETRRRRDDWLTPRLDSLTADERTTLADATGILRRLAQQ